ncbi:hypothetical protein AVEN_196283-1 [Araneus ventricosus]|uniref:Uncharacterized protein n=1 Tax=Araneus ventricosus TaxID=182803 RepID=A0A4Y2JIL5_ARAVE|nr:hypothetical protein AVEN_196283-1 [Araneus ventricosus]
MSTTQETHFKPGQTSLDGGGNSSAHRSICRSGSKNEHGIEAAYCFRPIHGGSSVESGFEPGTLRPQSRDLTTRPPRPYNDWKSALESGFKRRITIQEFLAHQSDRKLKMDESLIDYIYAKDALLEKAPFTIPQFDRI